MLQKSIHAGSIYTLPEDVKLTEPQIKSWLAAFLAMFNVDEQTHITQTWWLWRANDENELRARNGIPSSIEQIQWLFKTKRLTACMFEPRLSLTEVTVLKTTNELNETKRDLKDGALVACDICSTSSCTTVTCQSIVETFNKVARIITGGQCQTITSLFEAAANIRKTITKLRTQLGNLLHPDLVFQFENADFKNWKALSNGIRRAYDVKEIKNTMVSVFQSLNEIISSNKRAEIKVAAFKNLINRLTIKSEEEFIDARDMEGNYVFMNQPEEYNPIINTLFTFMLFLQIPETKWPTLQEDFERKIQAGWSYKNWHENRPKLYELIDKTQKQKQSHATSQVAQAQPAQEREYRSNSAPTSRSNSRARDDFNTRKRSTSIDRNYTREPRTFKDRKEAKYIAGIPNTNLCLHCTENNDRLVEIYHPPGKGFGGEGPCCIYDVNGDINGRNARRIIQKIYESNETTFLANENVYEITNDYSASSNDDVERDSTRPTRESRTQLCAVREGKIVNSSLPVIQGNFVTNKFIMSGYRKGSLTFDSGAARSFLHESHLAFLRHERSRPITREYFGAGGVKLKIRRHYYNVWISLDEVGEVCFKETLISTEAEPFRGMLVGRTDMQQLKVHIDFGRGTLGITKGRDNRGGFKTWLFQMKAGNQPQAGHENFIGGLKTREVSNSSGNTNLSNVEDEFSRNRPSGNPDRARKTKQVARTDASPKKRSTTIYDQLSDPALPIDLVESIYSKRYLTFLELSHDNERKAEADAAKFDCDQMLRIITKRAKAVDSIRSKHYMSEEMRDSQFDQMHDYFKRIPKFNGSLVGHDVIPFVKKLETCFKIYATRENELEPLFCKQIAWKLDDTYSGVFANLDEKERDTFEKCKKWLLDTFEDKKSATRRNHPGKRIDDCFSFKNRGECPRGENCRYKHDPKFEKKKKIGSSRARTDFSTSDGNRRGKQSNPERFWVTDGTREILVERVPVRAKSTRPKQDRSHIGYSTHRTVK